MCDRFTWCRIADASSDSSRAKLVNEGFLVEFEEDPSKTKVANMGG